MTYRELLAELENIRDFGEPNELDKDIIVYDELRDDYCVFAEFSKTVGDFYEIDDGHPIIIMSGIMYRGEKLKHDLS